MPLKVNFGKVVTAVTNLGQTVHRLRQSIERTLVCCRSKEISDKLAAAEARGKAVRPTPCILHIQ